MKHTLFILALITATIQTFAQSPRIKLNQITKDSVTGSVLISSPTDSGMVYSRELYISYGADTVLILGGDTLAVTSGIISSVLSDGVTITGDGTLGSELTADTSVLATLRALSDSLALVISSVTADGVTITGDGTVGSPLKVDTATVISSVGRLLDSLINVRTDLDLKQDQLNGTGFVKATGTTITYDNSTYLTSEVDGSVTNEIQDISTSGAAGNISISSGSTLNLNVDDADASATNELQTLSYNSSTNEITLSDGGGTEDLSNLDLVDSTRINATGDTAYYYQNGVLIGTGAIAGGGTTYNNISETVDTVYISDYLDVDTSTLYVDAANNRVGIGTTSPSADLEVVGDMIVDDSTLYVNADSNRVGIGTTSPDGKLSVVGEFSNTDLPLSVYDTRYNGRFRVFTNSSQKFIPSFEGYGGTELSVGVKRPIAVNILGSVDTSLDVFYPNDALIVFQAREYDNYPNGAGPVENASIFKVANYATPLLLIESDGGIFAPSLGAAAGTYPVEFNTSTKELTYDNTSSIRFKDNIRPFTKGLNELLQLNPVSYEYKETGFTAHGFIAEQVLDSNLEEIVTFNNEGLVQGLRRKFFFPLIVQSIQEQQEIIESQASEIEQLKSQIQLILSEIEQIKNN